MPTVVVDMRRPSSTASSYSGSTTIPSTIRSDKGGEGYSNTGIEQLLEDLIPRFTEITDLQQHRKETPYHLKTSSSRFSHNPDHLAEASDMTLLDTENLDISKNEHTFSNTSEICGRHGLRKAAEDDDWLISIDESLADDASVPIPLSPLSHSLAPSIHDPAVSPQKPASISIKGRASELTSPIRSQASSTPSLEAKSIISSPSSSRTSPTVPLKRDLPPHMVSSKQQRAASPSTSAVSVADGSHISSAVSSRVTLGTAAAGWQFDRAPERSWPKPILRDTTINTTRARAQVPPSILRLGGLSGPGPISGMRRAVPSSSSFSGHGPARPVPPSMEARSGFLPQRHLPPQANPSVPRVPQPGVNVEVMIRNVPQGCSKDELYSILGEQALHRAPFSPRDKKMNFWLFLPRPKQQAGNWGQTNEGHAFLTLPSSAMVHRFIAKYGRNGSSPPIKAGASRQPLAFELGNRVPPAGILEWLNRVPYPAKGDRSQRVINDRKADNIALMRMEFGVLCRDGVFSPEYIKLMKGARFSFDYRHRTFRISQIVESAPGRTPSTHLMVVKSSSIRLILSSVEDDEFSATLVLSHPPAYEELLSRSLELFDVDDEEQANKSVDKPAPRTYSGRQRRPGWDRDHQKTAAFTSRTIRFVFETENLRDDFEDLLLAVGCSHAKHVLLEADSRRLYSTSKRKAVHTWLAEVPSRSVAFQLACLYQNALLVPREVLALKPGVEELYNRKGAYVTSDILHQFVEELTRLQQRWFEAVLKDNRHETERDLSQGIDPVDVLRELITRGISRVNWRDSYQSTIMQCLHVVLTPTSMILEGPYPDQSNRPLRKYGHHDHFIRVAFMDEDKQPYYWGPDIDWTAFLDERVGAILREGIWLGGKEYKFLGYSMSSLRNRSTWFCTPFEHEGQQIDAAHIRANLGDFERVKRQPARYGARMAQAFTATDPSVVLRPEEIEEIPDVEKIYRGETLCFTDGVGRISLSLTQKVWAALHNGMEPAGVLPSAFQVCSPLSMAQAFAEAFFCKQFRLGGYKGVLTVDSALEGDKICVRPSQQKFDAPDSLGLEVAYTYTTFMAMFLNRPLIKVLEDLGVPHDNFLQLLKEAVSGAEQLKEYVRETRRQLTLHGLGGPFGVTFLVENIGALLHTNRIGPFKEHGQLATFIADSLEFAEVHILRLLKLKARIPVSKAHVGVAVADESGILKEGEIYAMRQNPGEPPYAVEGNVLLVRAPTVDVGDVQFARAVGNPPPGAERFHYLPNVVIFSTQGATPLLTQLSRGDMDGDLVGVIYDERLFPMRTEPAMQHQPKTPVDLPYDCTINEVIDFVLRFFRNDILGMIASRHLLIADQAPDGFNVGCGTRHPACKKLAELQTVAVDAPKSGQSVDLAEMPRPLFPHKPDFMTHEQLMANNEADEDSLIYHSHKVLGKLYRAISLTSQEMENQIPKEAEPLDAHYIATGEDDHILQALIDELEKCGLDTNIQPTDEKDRKDAWFAMHSYASDLRHVAWSNTMNSGHPLSEHELFIGTILHGPLATKQKQELTQRINLQSKELVDGVLMRLEGPDGRDRPQIWTNRILAALRVALSQMGNFGAATFASIAMRSCLYLLALMKDVRKAHAFASGFEADVEEPFMPVIIEDTPVTQVDLAEVDGIVGGTLGAKAVNSVPTRPIRHLNADEGGEMADWTQHA